MERLGNIPSNNIDFNDKDLHVEVSVHNLRKIVEDCIIAALQEKSNVIFPEIRYLWGSKENRDLIEAEVARQVDAIFRKGGIKGETFTFGADLKKLQRLKKV